MHLRAPEMHSHNWHVQVSVFADTAVREADVVLSIGYVAKGAEYTQLRVHRNKRIFQ